MIPVSLTTERVLLPDGSTAYPYQWNGETVPVRDNAANVLEIIALYNDRETPEDEKGEQIVERLFADPNEAFLACDFDHADFGKLIEAVTWDICGLDLGERESDVPIWDAEEDAAAIRTSLRMAYGIEWDAIRNAVPFSEFVALISGLPYETPLGCAMHYRNPKNRPEKDKYNKKQVAEFDRLHEIFKLNKKREGSHDRIEKSNGAMDDLALALVRKAG